MDENAPLRLWGKTDRPLNTSYHPLLFHLCDVAHCAAGLWARMPVQIKARMGNALRMSPEDAGRLFTLLAGLHDLGKAYPMFQGKAEYLISGLKDSGFDFPNEIKDHPHNFVSVPEAESLLTTVLLLERAVAPGLARVLAYSLGAHHGVFPQAADLTTIRGRVLGVNPKWKSARNWLAEELMVNISSRECPAPPQNISGTDDVAFAPMLAAMISLADWFGSSRYFVMQGATDVAQYRKMNYSDIARRSAATALRRSGWLAPPMPPAPTNFEHMFAYLDKDRAIAPNGLQRAVIGLLPEVAGPALWIIEEEMGAGKTEAAFTIFDHGRSQQDTHGIYVAMPTQATSNAMFDRLGAFLKNRNPSEAVNLILAHSHATLDSDYRKRIGIGEKFTSPVYTDAMSDTDGALLVRAWFTQSKQTLLSHYGVGTIDAALMGVLQTRHWFVRLFGLAHKVVIFDEVHAYDAYMNTLLTGLIKWLAELDCTVVLLSATLPKVARMDLANAYAAGSSAQLNSGNNQVAYPRVTLVDKGNSASARAVSIVKAPVGEPKVVLLEHCPNTPQAVLPALGAAIPRNGCAMVICNTVANAQKMFDELKHDLTRKGWRCLLFHARTPFKWRKAKEQRVLKLFGKGSGRKGTISRPKTLLVATQVVEQSLDLDADFMASEIAPVDLILQRIGRLHRHYRRPKRTTAQFALLYDENEETGVPQFGSSEHVYSRYILLRSWLELRGRTEIHLPTDIEPLISSIYDVSDPVDLPEAWTQLFGEAKEDPAKKQKEQRMKAKAVAVQVPLPGETFDDWIYALQPTLLDDDDPETHRTLRALTRDGDPSLTVVLCGTDEKGKPLAPDPEGYIGPDMTQRMMGFSLPLSQKAIYHALVLERPPANWQKSAHLRHCRRIVLHDGRGQVANLRLTLTEEKGLEIEKDNDA